MWLQLKKALRLVIVAMPDHELGAEPPDFAYVYAGSKHAHTSLRSHTSLRCTWSPLVRGAQATRRLTRQNYVSQAPRDAEDEAGAR